MTAISPYAPPRRQSSILSSSGKGDGRTLRRSSSAGAVVANGGAATLCWFFLRFWRRVVSKNNVDGDDGISDDSSGITKSSGGHISALLSAMADMVNSSLTIDATRSDDALSAHPPHRLRGIPAILRWIYVVVGGDRSRLGRVVAIVVGFTREALLRSLGAASIVLTGAPALRKDLLLERSKIAINGCCSMNGNAQNEKGRVTARDEVDLDAVKQERQQIDQVLEYWFGQAPPDGAQKSLWMIASSSVELLNQVDNEISHRFRALIVDLADENGDASPFAQGKLQLWTESVDLFGWHGKMAAIIALDQMSRHIHRRDDNHPDKAVRLPEQQTLDGLAYDIARKLQSEHRKDLSTGIIPIPMRIFGIMPLRHASTVEDLGTVQCDVESASALHEEMDRMIRRFRKATNRRMAALQDEARRQGKLGLPASDTKESDQRPDSQWTDEKILECFPFKADMAKARDHVVIKTMAAFLAKMNILQVSDARFKSSRKAATSLRDKSPVTPPSTANHVPTAIVSLSGGVDSMVIGSALAYLRDTEASRQNTHPDNILRIVAIHIDYANRPESEAEAAYVGRYCQELGAKFVCRKIDEVTRGVTARDDYERIAREIRFSLYRQCCDEASGAKEDGVGIMLGHHRGDLRENVISNAHKGCGPLDLSGMTAVSTNDGVTLFRPLLSLEKTHIYDYSHTFGVPYFKDTTPHWSTRGKLRTRLIPLLEEIYGEGSMDNLSSLAEESDDARDLVQQTVMGPFVDRVKRYPMGITFETSPWKDFGLFYWKFVLRQLLHSAGLGMFSDKSVESFLDRIRSTKLREGWLQCRKDYAVFLQKDGRVFVLYPGSFPLGNGQKAGQYDNDSGFLGYGSEHSMRVGPWTITSEIMHTPSEEEANSMLQAKALTSMEDLMTGDVRYFMKVPIFDGTSLPCPLIRVKGFTKPSRPAAWKGFDLKVETTLPLLGVDQSVQGGESTSQEFGKTWTIAEVRLLVDSRDRKLPQDATAI